MKKSIKFQILESFEIHDTLNKKLFDEEDKLKPEVREKLIEIADNFISSIQKRDIPVNVYDYWLVGSNAAYSYHKDSDIDVHILVDLAESKEPKILQALYDYIKGSWNDKFDVVVKGHPVELYLEDMNSSSVTNGIYSLKQDRWIKVPEKQEPRILDVEETETFDDFHSRYQSVESKEDIEQLLNDLYLLRKESLATEGEFGVGNLVFKEFRNLGYLQELKDKLAKIVSKELSLENLQEAMSRLAKATPYMIRNDGELIDCRPVHPYLWYNKGTDIIDKAITDLFNNRFSYLEWFYNNTQFNDVKKDIALFVTSVVNTDFFNINREVIKSGPLYVNSLSDYLQNKFDITALFEELDESLNQEFLRMRTSDLKFGGDNNETYFRISSKDFNWFDIIWKIVYENRQNISHVTVCLDNQSRGGVFSLYKVGDIELNHLPIEEFINLPGSPILERSVSLNNYMLGSGKYSLSECYQNIHPKHIVDSLKEGFSKYIADNFIKEQSIIEKENVENIPLTEAKADEQKLIDFAGEELAKQFFSLRNRLKSPENDLYYWIKKGSAEELEKRLKELSDVKTRAQKEAEAKEGAEKIYSDDKWDVYHITSYPASVKYGKDTQWCISGSKRWNNGESGEEYWNQYTGYGIQFYFYFDKKENTKYALALYPNGRYEVFNAGDNDISGIENAPKIDSLPDISFEEFTIEDGILKKYNDNGNSKKVVIPDSVTNIGNGAFSHCSSLTSVTIPNSVMSIGHYAFERCSSLTSITIPDSVTRIGRGAFSHCINLTSVTIPDSVTSIENSAFSDCSSLTSVTIPDSVTSIENYAFYDCSSLKSITIPDSVTSIGSYVFDGCNNLKDVYYAGSEEDWNKVEIWYVNSDLVNAKIHFNELKESTQINEQLKNRQFLIDKFKEAIYKYIPFKSAAQHMFDAKMKDLSDEEWKQISDFINSFKFPLTVYRGLKINGDISNIKLDSTNIGVNWTVDENIFDKENSAFKNSNIILKGEITEDQINYPDTIQNYIYYSLRPFYGWHPEKEVTIKQGEIPSNITIKQKSVE